MQSEESELRYFLTSQEVPSTDIDKELLTHIFYLYFLDLLGQDHTRYECLISRIAKRVSLK
ncbi:hypothetical protein J6590_100659, partial [Homalodisca vitripennis]